MGVQKEGNHGDEVAEVGDEEAVLGGTPVLPAAVGGEATEAAAMPVADVMALLQAMREEQLDTLKSIADGVQQLQSQVMVLGESANASEGNTSMVLSRLAALEIRIGSTPLPMNPHDRTTTPPYQIQPQIQQHAHSGGRVGGGVVGTGSVARIPAFAATAQAGSSPPVAGKVPLPPPTAVSEPGHVPTWQGRAEPEPARTHFMRTATSHARPSPAAARPVPPAAAARAVEAGGVEGGGRGEGDAEEAARKEAKRLAFMEDRARIQARISSKKGGGKAPAGTNPAPARASLPAEKLGAVQTKPLFDSSSAGPTAAGLSSPFATPAEGGGLFSSSPSFLDGGDGVDKARTGEDEEAAAWLEREKEQREQRERARREEEERVERQRAEAKRLKEEEQARKVREAEEARAREKARREAEAKKHAKTRVLMSSLFDKGEEDDGNSLFGGLGGAALPVFTDERNDRNDYDHGGSGTEQAAKIPVAPAPSVSAVASPPLSSGGGLFGGIEEPTAANRGGNPAPPSSEQFPSPMGELPSGRKAGIVFPEAESSGLFDSLPPPSQSRVHTGSRTMATTTNGGVTDEMDDFLSTLEAAGASAPSGGGTSASTAVRDSIFGDEEFAGSGNGDGLFSSLPPAGAPNRGATAAKSGPGTSLFDRTEFSIESGDDEGGNVFGAGGGRVGGPKGGGGENFGASFMAAMEDADLSLTGDGGKSGGGEGADREGMVDVTF